MDSSVLIQRKALATSSREMLCAVRASAVWGFFEGFRVWGLGFGV